MKSVKWFLGIIFIVLVLNISRGCSGQHNSSSITFQNGNTVNPQTQATTYTQKKLQPSDVAKAAANYDNSGAPYFITYDYDATNYLVSTYQSQQGPGNYIGGGALYLVNRYTGEILTDTQIDLDKVNFSKYLAVYSKLTKKVIE